MPDQTISVLCRYRLKPGKEKEFAALLQKHWPVLLEAGLVTSEPAKVQIARDQAGNTAYIETFAWKDHHAIGAAHQSTTVMKLWEPMGTLCQDMEFWHIQDAGIGDKY